MPEKRIADGQPGVMIGPIGEFGPPITSSIA
jgi:hypothetical protein